MVRGIEVGIGKEKHNLLQHFRRRSIERVGRVITQEELTKLLESGKLFFVRYCIEANRIEYIGVIDNTFYRLVYDLDYRLFVTLYKNTDKQCMLGEKVVISSNNKNFNKELIKLRETEYDY